MTAGRIVITGTNTDVGKTVFAAALTQALEASYWKPVQTGAQANVEADSSVVARLAGAPPDRILPEAYRFVAPCSPHLAAEIEDAEIDPDRLVLPQINGPLVVEGAGGVLVPLTRTLTYAEIFACWGAPVVLVAGTTLGTINHSLLSVEALRSRHVRIRGVAFVGEANPDSEAIIAEMGQVRRLGRLPWLAPLERDALAEAFQQNFDLEDFRP